MAKPKTKLPHARWTERAIDVAFMYAHPGYRDATVTSRRIWALAERLIDPETSPAERAEIIAAVARARRGLGDRRTLVATDDRGLAKLLALIKIVRRSWKYAANFGLKDASQVAANSFGTDYPEDAALLDLEALAVAIKEWPKSDPGSKSGGGDGKYKAIAKAVERTSFAKKWTSIKTDCSDQKSGRPKPTGKRKTHAPAK
ncbi:MAG TPA: hypothetical protein VK550_16590 [Polyangiaceae bacterium]|nr:hypothetical protein [Polyangiaceae bacterium]